MMIAWLVVLGLGLIAIIAGTKFRTNLTISIVNTRNLKWVLGIYITGLLLAIPVIYLLPKSGFLPSATTVPQFFDIYNAAQQGKLDQTKGATVRRQWSFAYDGNQLQITGEPATMIFAQRKASNDGKIDIAYYVSQGMAYYRSQGTLKGVDFSNMLQPPSVTLNGNNLKVTNPIPFSLNLAVFEPDFTINQFSAINTGQNSSGFRMQDGVILLRIPKNLTLHAQENLKYVGE